MSKYGLTGDDIRRLRSGLDTGLGTVVSSYSNPERIGSNALLDVVGNLIRQGTIRSSGPGSQFIQQLATDTFKEGMSKYDRPSLTGGILNLIPGVSLFTRGVDLLTGGSSKGMRGIFYGKNVLGLEGKELDNFAASVANNPNLFDQMMSTPEMQNYQLNEFRSKVNKDFLADMQRSDDNFVAEAAEAPIMTPEPGIPSASVAPFFGTLGLPTPPVLAQGVAPSLFSNFPQFNLSNYAQQGIANPNLINVNEILSNIT